MKNIKLLTLLFIIICFSCETTSVEDVIGEEDKPVVVYSTAATTMVNEEGNPQIVVNISMDKPIKTSTTFTINQIGGNAVEHEDYEVGGGIIPAYATEGELTITILEDTLAEALETLEIEVGAFEVPDRYEVIGTDNFSFTIENFESDDLAMSFDWDKGISVGGTEYGTCNNVDIDIYIADASGFDINNPFVNIYNDFTAATGACPEEWTLTFDDYADGEYILFTDLYDNAFYGVNLFEPIPVRTTFTRAGVFSETIEQDSSQVFNSDTAPGSDNGFIAKVIISNGLYTIIDYNGQIVING